MSREDERFMQKLVDSMVGIPKFAYPSRKNAPRPKENFATIALIEQYNIGVPVTKQYDILDINTGEVIGYHTKYFTAVTLRFRIGMYGTDGLPSIKVSSGWTTEASKALYIKEGYGYLKDTAISLEDELLEKDWNPRQGFSVFISATRVIEEDVCKINSVATIRGCYYEGDKLFETTINLIEPTILEPELLISNNNIPQIEVN